jgi:hypothetical protein
MRKTILVSTLLIVLILACGCTGSRTSTTSDVTPTQTVSQSAGAAVSTQTTAPTQTATTVPTTIKTTVSTPVPTPSPISLSGSGKEATEFFNLEKGLVKFTLTHNGDRNFAVWLMDSDGNREDLLVNEIGSFSGSHAIGIKKAEKYLLDITADGRWTVKIEQPRYTSAQGIPITFTGEGQKASDPCYLEKGLVRFKMTHDGDRNFAIWLLDSKGNREDLLVNEIGEFDGSKALGISSSGAYVLDITADGNWKIEMS